LPLDIVAVNTWCMEAVLAERMQSPQKHPDIFLAGDCAHAFPPSGGFGLNTGIGDAVNLAHKLSRAVKFGESPDMYEEERR
jgi:2-polyprenyl-6-methoxyphenol hydroxylase-like FAD-dependent oxidoreductase